MTKNKEREYGIEILRILLMIFIVGHHAIVHGFGFSSLKAGEWAGSFTASFAAMNAFFIVAVNVFFLISGYFGIQRKWDKVIDLHLQEVFYCLIAVATVCLISGGGEITDLIKALAIPELYYWFILVYIVLVIISPYIEKILNELCKREYALLLIGAIAFTTIFDFVLGVSSVGFTKGYSLLNGMLMYFGGGFIRRFYVPSMKKRWLFASVYVITSLITGICALLLIDMGRQSNAWNMYSYSSPIVVIGSVSLLLTFVGIKSNAVYKRIRWMSAGVLSTYLVTEFWPMREIVYEPVAGLTRGVIVAIPIFAFGMVVICSLVDMARRAFFSILKRKICHF